MLSIEKTSTVLLVDDDIAVLETFRDILVNEGVITILASDGNQALQALQQGLRPDLVLIDLMMPKVNGWEFCSALACDARLAEIPIIIMTGGIQIPLNLNFPALVGLLRKPVDIFGMLGMIEAVLAKTARKRH